MLWTLATSQAIILSCHDNNSNCHGNLILYAYPRFESEMWLVSNAYPKHVHIMNTLPLTLCGKLTYSDLWGPAQIKSIGGNCYYIGFIDGATQRNTVDFLKEKSKAANKVKNYVAWVKNQIKCMLKRLQVDGGKEFINADLKSWCAQCGIKIEVMAPYSHAQHGTAERPN